MKTLIHTILIFFLPTLLIAKEIQPEEIVIAHGEAMGGIEAWRSIESYQIEFGKENGVNTVITALMPDLLSISFDRKGVMSEKIFDGSHGYITKAGAYSIMRPGEVIEMAEEPEYYSELIFAIEYAYHLEYLGQDDAVGVLCHKVAMTKNSKDQQIYWIDPNTWLIRMTGEYSEDKAHKGIYYKTLLEDYRSIDGIMFPFKQTLIPSNRPAIVSIVQDFKTNLSCLTPSDFDYSPQTTRDLFTYWKDKYSEHQIPSFSFTQQTVRYGKDNSSDTSIWYEVIEYPDNFRIDFGSQKNGNTNLYRNDSIYVYRKGKLEHSGSQIQEFMIVEGALYSSPVDSTLSKLDAVGVDVSKFYKTTYRGRETYVIGADPSELDVSQVWIDKDRRSTIRRISKTKDGNLMEVRYGEFVKIDNFEIESWLEFYIEGELIQTERYYDIEVEPDVHDDVFHPTECLNSFWY